MFAYVADDYQCPGCEILETERRRVGEDEHGVHIRLIPRLLATALGEDDDE